MLLQLTMGLVALASMQAMKPTNIRNTQDEKSITILITLEEWPMLNYFQNATLYYEDTYTEREIDIWAHKLPTPRENLEIILTGNQYIYFSEMEITLNGGNSESWTNHEDDIEGRLTSGYYKMVYQNYYFTLEEIPQTANLKDDLEMYELINYYENNIFNGWYAFEKKYNFEYGTTQDIILTDTQTNNNSVLGYTLGSDSYEYENPKTANLRINIINENQLIIKNGEGEELPNNLFYFSNVTISNLEILQEYYNTYRILKPELLHTAVVNKEVNFTTFNPNAPFNISYGKGNQFVETNVSQKTIFEGLAKFNENTITELYNQYVYGAGASYVDKNGEIKTNNTQDLNTKIWLYTEGTKSDDSTSKMQFAWSTFVNKLDTNGNVIGTADNGEPKLFTNKIYIAFAENFNMGTFKTNFENVTYTTNEASGNVFNLLAMGFGAWSTIFQMKIGSLSLGTLVLAPVLVGFIIWLIHLMKRG